MEKLQLTEGRKLKRAAIVLFGKDPNRFYPKLKGEHNSRPRNPKIAKACFMAGYIDAWGRGTLKIYNSCKEHGLPEPGIMEKDGGFMVVLYKALQGTDENGLIGGQIGGQIEIFLAEFGTKAFRKKVDSEINKEVLMNNFGLFSEYFRSTFGITSDKLQDKFGKTSGKLQESLCQIGFSYWKW